MTSSGVSQPAFFAEAFPTLEQALASVAGQGPAGDFRIRIAQGTYRPGMGAAKFPPGTMGGDRQRSFVVPDSVTGIRGGYAGDEGSSSVPTGQSTILSGDIGIIGDNSDNCFHTMVVRRTNSPSIEEVDIQDLTIRDGSADSLDPAGEEGYGGGILVHGSNVRLTRVAVRSCFATFGGGGIAVREGEDDTGCSIGSGSFRARQIRVVNNSSRVTGGGFFIDSGQVGNISSSLFKGNITTVSGGGIFIAPNLTDVEIANCRIHDNSARFGGGIFDSGISGNTPGGGHRFVNCTIAFNIAADFGGGLYVAASTGMISLDREISNTIIFGNTGMGVANGDNLYIQPVTGAPDLIEALHDLLGPASASSAALPSGSVVIDTATASFMNVVPGWVNPAARNFRLASGSICIERGSDALIVADRADIDNDDDVGEFNQREFLMSDQALTGPNTNTRQSLVGGAFLPVQNLFTGEDRIPFGPICDIGSDEHRILEYQLQ